VWGRAWLDTGPGYKLNRPEPEIEFLRIPPQAIRGWLRCTGGFDKLAINDCGDLKGDRGLSIFEQDVNESIGPPVIEL
jgi:hypothetical protein